jgi:hypothetical protein
MQRSATLPGLGIAIQVSALAFTSARTDVYLSWRWPSGLAVTQAITSRRLR